MLSFLKNLFGGNRPNIKELLKNGAVVIDVRTPAEFKQGHARKAVNIPLQQIKGKINKIKQYNKAVITCCRSGSRSAAAKAVLKSHGIETYNGGSWQAVEQAMKS